MAAQPMARLVISDTLVDDAFSVVFCRLVSLPLLLPPSDCSDMAVAVPAPVVPEAAVIEILVTLVDDSPNW